ncbi:ankyrin [Neolentinus lepideus HHB14362 ss-1]|uniref:Ankyrin n=1 Tax=Neolentinus lepideus HHB14362 ss-1 TaxID=1314782 RepID=A0A165VQU1_9AGAM|nr:ankyrin [Neolentinus lepideus HHB14362 ss-1]
MIARSAVRAGKSKSTLRISAVYLHSHQSRPDFLHANPVNVAARRYSSQQPSKSQSDPELNMADGADSQQQNGHTAASPSVDDLTPETLAFAARMFDAARQGNTELLVQATQRGLPANLTNEKGNTILMLAAYAGQTETVRALLTSGADPNRLNDNLQSPLAGAIFKGNDEIAKILLDAGADPRLGKPSAIETAKMFGKDSMLETLGAKPEDVGNVPEAVRRMAEANAQKH